MIRIFEEAEEHYRNNQSIFSAISKRKIDDAGVCVAL
jgi:hypothetical protein